MRAYDLIRSRRTVREFEDRPLGEEAVTRWIEAATFAPNFGLTQPWRFSALGARALPALASAVAACEARVPPAPGTAGAGPLRGAPAAVAVWQLPAPDQAAAAADRLAIGAAVQNLLLCAWDDGIGALWIGGEVLEDRGVRAACGEWPEAQLVALIALGRPEAVPPLPRRRRLSEVLRRLD